MLTTCLDCKMAYDDARRSTICPHLKIMSDEDMDQKDAGLALIGKMVRFAHQPDGPDYQVTACGWNGMVAIDGMEGMFAPHLFTVVAVEGAS